MTTMMTPGYYADKAEDALADLKTAGNTFYVEKYSKTAEVYAMLARASAEEGKQ